MPPPSPGALEVARQLRQQLAGQALTQFQAKLYSQSLRLAMGRPGLASFAPTEADARLEEAALLLECAFIERSALVSSEWKDGVKRAAEILEWLSQRDLSASVARAEPEGGGVRAVPLHLLAGAAYQLAGFPALALGHLQRVEVGTAPRVLTAFLRGDFPTALEAVRAYWGSRTSLDVVAERPESLSFLAIQHVVMCIGVICAYVRTGTSTAVTRAVAKIDRLALVFLQSRDPYSWILARLTAEVSREYVASCIWPHIEALGAASDEAVRAALVQFARVAFTNRRSLVWPTQVVGIDRLRNGGSFILCTPTGSGKTSIATLASIQALYEQRKSGVTPSGLADGSLILYLVPSRALAAEVEARLSEDLRGMAPEPVVVTGLYGGNDWGPTDAWIDRDQPTLLIGTFEKADALLRYLGMLFLHRVRLVVIDEAHMVDQSTNAIDDLERAASRPLRLEQLVTRLLHARDSLGFRIVALSAVAAKAAPALARWISGSADAIPAASGYRSTRQMVGRLFVSRTGEFRIQYDLLNGRSLQFEERSDSPFVRSPFPPCPTRPSSQDGPEVRMRAPTLWAALHLAAERTDSTRPAVLISVTQDPQSFGRACLETLVSWPVAQLPPYWGGIERDDRWARCLAAAADYFTEASTEYRLLQRGIALHHGKLPPLLGRRLKQVIDAGFVRVVIASSTLSEGVNIPVNYVLIPSLFRSATRLSLQEFGNLVGRVGRPGHGTEGQALVVLPEAGISRQSAGYDELRGELEASSMASVTGSSEDSGASPLAQLLRAIEDAWRLLAPAGSPVEFEEWLEKTAVTIDGALDTPAVRRLDVLDGFILSALQEIEDLRSSEVPPAELEAVLARLWQQTYASAAEAAEERLRHIWLVRGRTTKARYPDAALRRDIYRTSLTPRSALSLIGAMDALRARLVEGTTYAAMDLEAQFAFVAGTVELLGELPTFKISTKLGRRRKAFEGWRQVLRWWLAPSSMPVAEGPSARDIGSWYDFAHQNFTYRANWALGSALGLLLGGGTNAPIRALEIDDWPRSGLPWVAFWLKELITWGTLDPVVAFLMARGDAVDRARAATQAADYYSGLARTSEPNDRLDPRRVRDWVLERTPAKSAPPPARSYVLPATLKREAEAYRDKRAYVAPLRVDNTLNWIDAAGYVLATSAPPPDWPTDPSAFDFELSVDSSQVSGQAYHLHRYTRID